GPFTDQAIRLPGLAVVGEVGADDALLVHPQVAVVVLVIVTGGRGAGDNRSARPRDEDARGKGFVTGVFIDDIGIFTSSEIADLLAKTAQLFHVLRAIRIPKFILLSPAVNDPTGADGFTQFHPFFRRHDTNGKGPRIQHILDGKAAEPADRSPNEDDIAL